MRAVIAGVGAVVAVFVLWAAIDDLRMNRRSAEGKSKRYIIRCLKRYVAREVFRALPR